MSLVYMQAEKVKSRGDLTDEGEIVSQ